MSELKYLCSPITVRGRPYPNRIVVAPMLMSVVIHPDGIFAPGEVERFSEFARNGSGCVIVGETDIDPVWGDRWNLHAQDLNDPHWNLINQLYTDFTLPDGPKKNSWRQIARAIHGGGALAFVQLFHAGNMRIGLGKVIDLGEAGQRYFEEPSVTANTIEELAEKMEVPVEKFKATVARYNELARLGKDLDFGKRPDRLTAIDKPPYYAGKGRYALLVVMGGIVVNASLQALDKDWEVIPGLYLAGNTMGNRFAIDYPTMVPGISNGMSLTYGRVAGLNAAAAD